MSKSSPDSKASLKTKVQYLELLNKVGIALSSEQNKNRLLEMILIEAKKLCNADGGTLYLRTEDNRLRFTIVRTASLHIAMGGTADQKITFYPIRMFDAAGKPNLNNVATYAANLKKSINIPDAYHAKGFDFSGTKAFDACNHYRSISFLTIPMVNSKGDVIGVLQLINALDRTVDTPTPIPFTEEEQHVVEALASQAAVALDNQMLLERQKELLESFIKLIATSIDAKSPYTGGHCERVPILTLMLAKAAQNAKEGPFKDFHLSEEEWYELRIAAWLHDCGKVTTPVHVMDKATKLETIFDRIHSVQSRFEVLKRDAEIEYLRALQNPKANPNQLKILLQNKLQTLEEEFTFIEEANRGGEFLSLDKQERIRTIGKRTLVVEGKLQPLFSEDELDNLVISRGTLAEQERIIINGHMVETIKMLETLPFPESLERVPEYAGGHHERMDGSGYPKGLYAGDMSIPARIMAIADVFEALTAQDRPYKKAKTLSESMCIMGFMKRDNHLDPDLFNLFVEAGIYREYGKRYLAPGLLDKVDEESLLQIEPKKFDLPPKNIRKRRWVDFLPEYHTIAYREQKVPK